MFKNVNAKKRLTQVIVAFMVICMTLTGSFLLLDDFIKEASAAERVENVEAGNATDLKNKLAGVQAGETVTINVPAGTYDIGGKFGTIDAGETVNLVLSSDAVICWDKTDHNNTLLSTSYSSGDYASNKYCGLITNNGTLNIQGSGTIRIKQIDINSAGGAKDTLVQKVYTLVNGSNAKLTLGSSITVESYLSYVNTSGDRYSQPFIYNCAVYNSGTVDTSATIKVGSMSSAGNGGANISRNDNYRAYSMAYGIYGGNVNATGGSIFVDSYAGGFNNKSYNALITNGLESHAYASAVGIYSTSSVKILGNTTINVLSKDWRGRNDSNSWKDGVDQLLSVGIMYTGTNYPVIGPSVDVVSSYEHVGDGKINVHVPGTESNWGDFYSADKGGNSSWAAAPVLSVSTVSNNIGQHTSEKAFDADGGFFGATTPWATIGSGDTSRYQYIPAQSYFSGANTRVSASQVNGGGSNDNHRNTAAIVNGAPGGTGTGGVSSTTSGDAGAHSPAASGFKKGSQYLVVYRYYSDVTKATGIDAVSFKWNNPTPQRIENGATINVGGAASTNGIMPDGSTKISYAGGGASLNERFYKFAGAKYQILASNDSGLAMKLEDINTTTGLAKTPGMWTGDYTGLGDGTNVATDKDNVIVVYMDYECVAPTQISVVASNNDIVPGTTSVSFTVGYTGSAIKPGEDFKLGIIDKKDENDPYDDEVVTTDYDISGKATTNVRAVRYRYKANGAVAWIDDGSLPIDVGTYSIEVTVTADTTYAPDSFNRAGTITPVILTCTITPAEVTIKGDSSKTVAYGSKFKDIIKFADYSAENKSKEPLNGSWTLTNVNPDTYPTVGRYTVDLKWSPSDNGNYKDTTLRITVDVTKRDVTVSAGDSAVTYGDPGKFAVAYSTDLGPDADKAAGWLANSEFEVKYSNGEWGAYYPSLPVGAYEVRIKNFGGTGDENNNFIVNNETVGTLNVTKRNVYYTATATDKIYDRNTTVDVTLNYQNNKYANDDLPLVVETTGRAANNDGTFDANAGQNKKVVVNVAEVMSNTSLSAFASNYNLVISNAADLKVNVAKATPGSTQVAVKAVENSRVYDAAKTLSSVALEKTADDIAGNWKWVDDQIVPTVAVSEYTAEFTPSDTTNYNTITQKVTLNVTKATVYVTVAPITITYGAAVPPLTLAYNGFTGNDTLASVKPDGNALASTNYSIGSNAGEYTITVSSELEAANYEFVAQNSTITVNPKAVTVKPVDKTITYGEAVGTIGVTETGFLAGESLSSIGATVNFVVKSADDQNYVPGADFGSVGDYVITADVDTTNGNYDIKCESGTLTVKQAVLTVKPDENALKLEYGEARPAFAANKLYTITGFYGDDTAQNAITNEAPVFNTDYIAGSSVGSYAVTVNVQNMTAKNYSFVGAEGTITVIKTNPVVQTNPGVTVINSNKLSTAVFDNSADVINKHNFAKVEGAFAFKNADEVPAWSLDEYTRTAVFTPRDTTNYNTVEVSIIFRLQAKTISGTPVIQGSAMVESELKVSLDSMDPKTADSYTYQWYAGDTAIPGATAQSYTIDKAYEDSTIKVEIVAITDKGFKGSAMSHETSAVIAALLATTADQFSVVLPEGVVYDALSHKATVKIADNYKSDQFGDTITVKYNGSVNAPSAAGTYIVTVDINAPEKPVGGEYNPDYHYGPATGINVGKFTIEQAPFTVTISVPDKVYDGTTDAGIYATVTGSGAVDPIDDVNVVRESVNFAFDTPDVGTDKTIVVSSVTLVGADAANYKPVTVSTTASITPRPLTVVPNASPKDYDKSNKIDITFSVSGYAPGESASSVYLTDGVGYTTDANAGKNKIVPVDSITYTVGGPKSHNYKIELSGDCFVEIRKIDPDFTPVVIDNIDGQPIVYDANRNLSTIAPNKYHSDEGTWTFADTTIVPTVPQRTYAAIYRPNDQTNYNNVEGEITIIVEKRKVTLTAEDKTVVYGSKAPNYTLLKPVGFTGSDSLENCVGGSWLPECDYYAGMSVGIYSIDLDVSGLSSDNYYFEGASGDLIVSPATVNVSATSVNKIYDGNNAITVNFKIESGIFENDDVYLTSSSITGAAATANAGTTTVGFATPALTGEITKLENYIVNVTPASGVLTVEIAKADVPGEFRFPTDVRVQFGFDLTYVTFGEPGVGDGTFAYENAKQIVPGGLGEYDTYTMIFTPTDSRNYNTKEAKIPFTVDKCVLNYVVGVSGTPQSGQTLTAVTTGLPAKANEYIKYQWYRVDNGVAVAIKGANDKSYVATDDDVGYSLYVMTYFDLSSAPYEFADSIELDSFEEGITGILGKVSDAIQEIKLTFWQRLLNWIRRIIEVLTGLKLSGILGG